MRLAPETFEVTASDGVVLRGARLGNPSGPTVMFSHSLGCTSDMWRQQADDLSAEYFLVLLDTRGHGRSQASEGAYSLSRLSLDVLEVMDCLDIAQASFCGLSLGGMIGQALAVRAPDRLEKFILAATSQYMGPPEAWQTRIDTVLRDGMASVADAVLARWFAPEGSASDAARSAARDWLITTSPAGYAGSCAAIRDMDMRRVHGANRCRTLIIAGEQDTATPLDHAQSLQAAIERSEVVTLKGGHLINLEQPQMFSKSVADFLTH